MKQSLAQNFWNASPKRIVEAVRRRLSFSGDPGAQQPRWLKIQAGPLVEAEMLLAPTVSGSWREMAEGTFDAFLFEALTKHGPITGATVWDIGAHFGYHTLCFARLVGEGGRVVAFEPNPFNAQRLHQHLARNRDLAKRIEVVPSAVSASDGETTFVFSSDVESGDSSCSFIREAVPPQGPEAFARFREQSVRTICVDTFFHSQGGAVPRVIKIDVEGAELLVLRGGSKFFAEHKPVLLMEIHHIRLMFHVQKLLCGFGYNLAILNEGEATPSRCFIVAN
ncbi:MAG: FkbM family methyltransferase [Limisphaerales bacterium]